MPTRIAVALFRSSHPLPSAAVTGTTTLLAIAAGNSVSTCVVLAAAVLAGQLSVGWSNDRIDAERDRRVGHRGKPVAADEVSARAVEVAIAFTAALTVVLSLALGWRAGGMHLGAVAVGWLYNSWLKRTWLSWLPYAISFAALPAVATLALSAHPWPAAWVVIEAALLGTSVNFVNAVQDLAAHPASDVRGLPDRIGGQSSLVVAALLLLASGVTLTWGPAGGPTDVSWAGLAITVAGVAVGIPLFWQRANGRSPFYGLILIATAQVITTLLTGHGLH